jgi:formamidopyrimidine-DNA glycosylase
MPELPEVEVIVTGLRDKLVGLKLEGLKLFRPQLLEHTSFQELNCYLLGQTIARIGRRGKYIVFGFENGCVLTTHLRMSGCYLIHDTPKPPTPYTRLCFNLSRQKQLQYQDKRALGRIRLYLPGARLTELEVLGIEPLGNDFTVGTLMQMLSSHKRPIKPMLLDQKLIAGIGNIYASEILFTARISPMRKADTLSKTEAKRLHRAIRDTLLQAIASQGTHISDYVDSSGKRGEFGDLLKVYARGGKRCIRCGGTILRIIQQQRSTFYCPGCQR